MLSEDAWEAVKTSTKDSDLIRLEARPGGAASGGGSKCSGSKGCCSPAKSSSGSCCSPATSSSGACCAPAKAKSCCGSSKGSSCCGGRGDADMKLRAAAEMAARAGTMGVAGHGIDGSAGVSRLEVNRTRGELKYSGSALRAVALPFGGVGGGCVSLAGDGGLRQWQCVNEVEHTAQIPDSFFAIRVDPASEGEPGSVQTGAKACVLMSDAWYDSTGFTPAPMISDADVPASSIALLKELPGTATLSMEAKFPTATVSYDSLESEVGVSASMTTWSPFVPLDSKSSGMPLVCFSFQVKNTATSAQTVSLAMNQQNFVGWDGHSDITDEICNPAYGGNSNDIVTLPNLTAVTMTNPSLAATAAKQGTVACAVLDPPSGATVTTLAQSDSAAAFWAAFTASSPGLPGSKGSKVGPSPSGRTWNGAVCTTATIAPGATETFTFVLAWHFPNRIVDWGQPGLPAGAADGLTLNIGNNYANVWPTMTHLLSDFHAQYTTLFQQTQAFQTACYGGTLAPLVVDAAAPRAVVLRTPTYFWAGDGRMYNFEGCSSSAGCCPLNCSHVDLYQQGLAHLFPDLQQTVRETDLQVQIAPNAIIPSRTILPRVLSREWMWWGPTYTDIDPASTAICVDGEIATVNKLYREVLVGTDMKDWFPFAYGQAKRVLQRWMTDLDTEGDGLVRGPQPNTYDCSVYGVNPFITTQYLCALQSGEAMANLAGDPDFAKMCSDRATLGKKNFDAACYTNGKYYTQVVDPKNPVKETADGTFVDALVGQWWATLLGLEDIVTDISKAKSHVEESYTANHRTSFNPAEQHPRKFFDQRDAGMFICRWPSTPPSDQLLYTSEGAWSGLEGSFGGLALLSGATDVFNQIFTDQAARQDGTRRSPWNQIECGDHYTRQMSAFAILHLAGGIVWNSPAQTISFAPRLGDLSNYKGPFFSSSAWGTITSSSPHPNMPTGTITIDAVYAPDSGLPLKQINIGAGITANTATVTLNGTTLPSKTSSPSSGTLVVTLDATATVPAGSSLVVTVSTS